jgi:hypothetical protein
MLSPRTAKYVETLIREGDSFDYRTWLQQVRYEEAEARQTPAAFFSGEPVAFQIGNSANTPDHRDAWVNSESASPIKTTPNSRAVYRSDHKGRIESQKDRLRRRLMSVSDAFDEFQESRVRDAVYVYLRAVFALVVACKGRRRTKRLLQSAFQFAGLLVDKNADPFATVIRCTSERDVDNKTISKWARALRYAAHCKRPRTPLKIFVKKMGGINACAERHTIYLGRGRQ